MQTRSKTKLEAGLSKVPCVVKKSRMRPALGQTEKTVNPFKKTKNEVAVQLLSSNPKRLASEANKPISGKMQTRFKTMLEAVLSKALVSCVVKKSRKRPAPCQTEITDYFEAENCEERSRHTHKKRSLSVTFSLTDKQLSEANSLFHSKTVDLTDVCFNTNISDSNWILRKYLGLPVPSTRSDIAAWDNSILNEHPSIDGNCGTVQTAHTSTDIFPNRLRPSFNKIQNAPKAPSDPILTVQMKKNFLEAYKLLAAMVKELGGELEGDN